MVIRSVVGRLLDESKMSDFVRVNDGTDEGQQRPGTYRFQADIPKLPVPELKVCDVPCA